MGLAQPAVWLAQPTVGLVPKVVRLAQPAVGLAQQVVRLAQPPTVGPGGYKVDIRALPTEFHYVNLYLSL